MADYEKLYKILFNGITDTLEMMENHSYITAQLALIRLQQKAEDMFIQSEAEQMDT